MSANPKPAEPQCEMTDEDFNSLMAAEIWLQEFNLAGGTLPYQKMWIAVHGDQVVAADQDRDELYQKLDALGDTINRFRVLVRYVHSLDELYLQP